MADVELGSIDRKSSLFLSAFLSHPLLTVRVDGKSSSEAAEQTQNTTGATAIYNQSQRGNSGSIKVGFAR